MKTGVIDTQPAEFHVGSISFNTSSAPTTTAETGLGFKPRAVMFISGINAQAVQEFGFSDGTIHAGWGVRNADQTMAHTTVSVGRFYNVGSTSDIAEATVSFDTDGFTISWTVAGGSPTGAYIVKYLALK